MNLGPVIFIALPVVCALLGALGILKPRTTVIGVDLGTTYSVVAFSADGNITVIPFEGSLLTPSVVSLLDNGSLIIGEAAKARSLEAPLSTAYDAKRLIGKRWSDIAAAHDARQLSCEVIPAIAPDCLPPYEENCPDASFMFQLTSQYGTHRLTPQAVGTVIIDTLIANTKAFLGHGQVHAAVVAVPAKFNQVQIDESVEVFTRAGLQVGRVIEEPTAAAVAYGLHLNNDIHYVAVFDFGGGTLDVSILYMSLGAATVMSTAGDDHLGGEDFDYCLMQSIQEFLRDLPVENIEWNEEHLKQLAERAKRALSTEEYVELQEGPFRQHHHRLLRSTFEQACSGLFERTQAPVDAALSSSGLTPDDIDAVVLVGGSSRLPRVRELLAQRFSSEKLHFDIDPDLAVAIGAARVVD